MMSKSDLEQAFLFYINALQLPAPAREWRFHPVRRWRFDFAWPDCLVAVECEGGTWSGGRHVRGRGFENDCWKYSAAAVLGWKVLRVTGGMLDKDALGFLDLLIKALGNGEGTKMDEEREGDDGVHYLIGSFDDDEKEDEPEDDCNERKGQNP